MYQGHTDMLKLHERISMSLLHFVVCAQVVILNAVLHVVIIIRFLYLKFPDQEFCWHRLDRNQTKSNYILQQWWTYLGFHCCIKPLCSSSLYLRMNIHCLKLGTTYKCIVHIKSTFFVPIVKRQMCSLLQIFGFSLGVWKLKNLLYVLDSHLSLPTCHNLILFLDSY